MHIGKEESSNIIVIQRRSVEDTLTHNAMWGSEMTWETERGRSTLGDGGTPKSTGRKGDASRRDGRDGEDECYWERTAECKECCG